MATRQTFADEVSENIRRLGEDADSQTLAHEWMRGVILNRYSYNFRWLGRPVIQYPQDLVAMQEIVWKVQPRLIVEAGIAHGGSLIFYASLLELIGGDGEVLGIDVDIREHNRIDIEQHPMFKRISMNEGSSTDEDVARRVFEFADGKGPVVVALDSMHTHEHVMRELELYSPLVGAGSYIVVFDTFLEMMPEDFSPGRPWGPGNNPGSAVSEFLRGTDRFVVDRDYDHKLMISANLGGYLRCIKDA